MTGSSGEYRHNHYVPEWYQRRFMSPGQSRYYRLDLKPEILTSAGGRKYKRHDVHHWSPENIFAEDNLYTTQWGTIANTEIERFFFGKLDNDGRKLSITLRTSNTPAAIKRRSIPSFVT
jgi:hypothetical protein